MQDAFERVMNTFKTNVKNNDNITKQYLYSTRHLDYNYFIDMFFFYN